MKRALAVVLALAGAPPVFAQEQAGTARGYANPSAVIAAELALSRDAAARGEWTAMAAAGAADAVLFTPQLAWAQPWLKRRPSLAQARRWQPYEVWSSCDGSLVASRGVWTGGDGKAGTYARLWQRQADGRYKWLVIHEAPSRAVTAEPEMIAAHVADCPARAPRLDAPGARSGKPPKPPRIKDLPSLDPLHRAGSARDGTLKWDARVGADGTQHLSISWTTGGSEQSVPEQSVPVGRP